MEPFRALSTREQLAEHLRRLILRGEFKNKLPGTRKLVQALGVNSAAMTGAIKQLEREGLLVGQGPRRGMRIAEGIMETNPQPLRVRILLYEKSVRAIDYLVELRHQLEEAGHHAAFADKSLHDLGMNPARVKRYVEQNPADAWVVVAASKEVLQWFAEQEVPAFALFGRLKNTPLAGTGPHKSQAIRDVVQRLTQLGHRRIVLLCREERRKPAPGFVERVFLDELDQQGVATGPYNLPDWGNTMAEFHEGLDKLWRVTPPTALLCSYTALYLAAENYLAHRGIVAPRDVSLVCLDPDPAFAWCRPPVSHVSWDSRPVVRRVMHWVRNISKGVDDRRNSPTRAKFIEGGTIGPAH